MKALQAVLASQGVGMDAPLVDQEGTIPQGDPDVRPTQPSHLHELFLFDALSCPLKIRSVCLCEFFSFI